MSDLSRVHDDWQEAAQKFSDDYHDELTKRIDAETALTAERARNADMEARIGAGLQAAFSGDEFEENAQAAAGEGEWSWFRWLALDALDRALLDAAPAGGAE